MKNAGLLKGQVKFKDLLPDFRNRKFYFEKDPASRIEDILLAEKISGIGNLVTQQKTTDRSTGLDMAPKERDYRTQDIWQLSREGLNKLHAFEQEYMNRFAIGPSEISPITGEKIKSPANILKDEALEELIKFNNEHRPIMDRKFRGIPIPPYFIYDYEFDGMCYQHAWDLSVWYAK